MIGRVMTSPDGQELPHRFGKFCLKLCIAMQLALE